MAVGSKLASRLKRAWNQFAHEIAQRRKRRSLRRQDEARRQRSGRPDHDMVMSRRYDRELDPVRARIEMMTNRQRKQWCRMGPAGNRYPKSTALIDRLWNHIDIKAGQVPHPWCRPFGKVRDFPMSVAREQF